MTRGPRPWLLLFALLFGCRARVSVGVQCSLSSDCAEPLVCASGLCRSQCAADRDCASGGRCVLGADPSHPVCVAASSTAPLCRANTDCTAGWLCATEGYCTLPCGGASGCSALPAGWTCSATRNRCVPPEGSDAQVPTDASQEGGLSTRVRQVALGGSMSCARLDDGTARCWGSNRGNELGDGTQRDAWTPLAAPGVAGAVQLLGSNNEQGPVCARTGDGHVLCPTTNGFAAMPGIEGAIDGAQATNTLYARRADGTVLATGQNDRGQLGLGDLAAHTGAVSVPGLRGVLQLSTSGDYACAVESGGTVLCWGSNEFGQLGLPGARRDPSPTPTRVPGLDSVAEVRAGGTHACARLVDGTVRCWGTNLSGCAAPDLAADVPTPRAVPGLANVVELGLGSLFSCARLGNGTVRCWGANDQGQRGDDGANGNGPSEVTGLRDAVELAVGTSHACARRADGTLACWGTNHRAQLGLGRSSAYTRSWRAIAGYSNASSLAGGLDPAGDGSTFLCGVSGGRVLCHGANSVGQLGSGDLRPAMAPAMVPGLTSALGVSAGTRHVCAWLEDQTARCWGACASAECGDNVPEDTRPRTSPVVVQGLSGVRSIVSTEAANCALRADGTVWCWGSNRSGELGRGSATPSEPLAAAVPGLTSVAQLAALWSTVCARKTDGTVWCWGYDAGGECGAGSTRTSRSAPTAVVLPRPAVELAAGNAHACARLDDNSLYCWGSEYGALGNPLQAGSNPTPLRVLRPGAVPAGLLLGAGFSCLRDAASMVRCWGSNAEGQYGDGLGLAAGDAVAVPDPAGSALWMASISAHFRCVLAAGSLQCTGWGPGLGLGDRGTAGHFTPQRVAFEF